jgi:hypothetical protein
MAAAKEEIEKLRAIERKKMTAYEGIRAGLENHLAAARARETEAQDRVRSFAAKLLGAKQSSAAGASFYRYRPCLVIGPLRFCTIFAARPPPSGQHPLAAMAHASLFPRFDHISRS